MTSQNIIVTDTETTGISPFNDRLVEVAGTRLPDWGTFTTLVNPERDIPAEARAIHHIGPEDVSTAPVEYDAVYNMVDDLGTPDIFVAHNAKFDRKFIERIAPELRPNWICTLKCAQKVWPEAPAHKNQVLRYWLGIDVEDRLPSGLFPHRALYDTIVTAGIFIELQKHMSIAEMIEYSNHNQILKIVGFGKHKGMAWKDVPPGYLRWCVGQDGLDEDVKHTANHYLRGGR
jgi:exodeoxyribonuclease X